MQADRQGHASDFGAAYAKSEYKRAADKEIVAQLAMASDLGGWWVLAALDACATLISW